MTSGVLCFGEALIDLRAEPADGQSRFVPQPGGAPANVAVGIARLGGRAAFAGQIGADYFGDRIAASLAGFGVDITWLARTGAGNTALALVALDDRGERSFSFYRNATADLLYRAEQLPPDAFAGAPAFHFCSNTLTEPAIRETTRALVTRARAAGCLVSFDINYRPSLWPGGSPAPEQIRAMAGMADLVKFSREELLALYPGQGDAVVQSLRREGVALVLVSDGANTLEAWTETGPVRIAPPSVRAVDTTAAGDSLVAGLLYQLARAEVTAGGLRQWLDETGRLQQALDFASRCGAVTATRFGAFDALPSQADLKALEQAAG